MTARQSIGGRLDYAVLAQRHRPCSDRIAAEVVRLHNEDHLSALDISVAIHLAYDVVINIISSLTIEQHQ